MAEKLRRPAPFTPLSATFHTGRTGTAILDEFGLEGIGVWAAMLAEARHEQGLIVFRHDEDWAAIGLAAYPASFPLKRLLTFLGQRKQTRTTRHGRVMYVELTRWEEWNKVKERADSAWRMSRKRAKAKRNSNRTQTEPERDSRARGEPEPEVEPDKPPDPPYEGGQRISRRKARHTGCRITKGTHGVGYIHDPLGTDRPPPDWPHPTPTPAEVKTALSQMNGQAMLREDPERYVKTAGFALDPAELERVLELYVPDEDDRFRLIDIAADLRSATE